MKIQLSDHFTYTRLIRFVLPSIIVMVCTSIYSIVDGFFVSNYVGKTPFAAINLIMPIATGIGTIGFMISTGGSAIVSKTLGEGKKEQANQYFSLLVYTAAAISIFLGMLGFIFIRPLSAFLGASGEMLTSCVIYRKILCLALPTFILQVVFQNFFIVAEKPTLSLSVSLLSGLTNIVLDFLFITVCF